MTAPLLAGRYRLLEVLSSTRMAEVWLAVDVELDRHVVVKPLAPEADRERFEREALAVTGPTTEVATAPTAPTTSTP
jgi:serine/threonine protein kinase